MTAATEGRALTADWRTLPAGRALDALVDTKLFGHATRQASECCDVCWIREGCTDIADDRWQIPKYSEDIAAAWLVVGHLHASGWLLCGLGKWDPYDAGDAAWSADIGRPRRITSEHHGFGSTAPLAICRAALAASEAAR